ncbi:hypothetical protein [Brucella tritici]|uniref:hypothetical protein n=1 Tax=Brucella tritici TaxID=94626 RepID=UPI00178C2503|nr:hypothetical protein [Brucella tritici]
MTGAGTVASRQISGAVSQSGGVPTGAIVEYGNNANGHFTRFADGTQICRHTGNLGAATTANGALYLTDGFLFPFPAAFSVTPSISFGAQRVSGSGSVMAVTSDNTLSSTGVTIRGGGTFSGAVITVYFIAIGRWY